LRLRDIAVTLNAEILVAGSDIDQNIETIHASDLISQVLASCSRGALWITGLLDTQIINTAELFDLAGVVFVGNRRPGQEIIDAAIEENIPVLLTNLTMFETCGLLYEKKLQPAKRKQ